MELHIRFKTNEDYTKAVEFVNNDSEFYAEENDQWMTLVVDVSDQHDADVNEKGIEEELIEEGIENFYFEIED
jgi:hypothetical protein